MVSLKNGIAVNRMVSKWRGMDTGVGLNIVGSALLRPKCLGRVKPLADPGLTAATRQTVDVQGVITLIVQIENLPVRV